MVSSVELSTAVSSAPARNPRPTAIVAHARDGFAPSLSGSLFMIPLGCLLAAMLVATALSRVAPTATLNTSSIEATTELETEPGLPTIDEVETGGLLRPFAEAYAR